MMAAIAPISAAHAGEVTVGADGLVGIAKDDRPLGDSKDRLSGGILPSIQFGDSFVIQADGMLFEHRKDTNYGGALHAGFRLNERGFVGVYGSISEQSFRGGLNVKRIGGEFSASQGDFTLTAVAGYEDTNRKLYLVTTTEDDDVYYAYGRGGQFFSFADVKYQPSDKFRISVGHRYTGGRHAGAAGIAFGLSGNASIIAEGRLGERDYKAAFVGLRVRFGGDEEGPSKLLDNRLIEDLFSESNTRRTLLDPLPPPEEEPGEGGYCGSCGGYCE